MEELSPIVFGKAPPGIVCRDRPAAYAVIHNSAGHVAVVCANVRGRDQFWLPGGGIHDDESPQQTIAREVNEELGRHVTLHRKIGAVFQFFYASDEACWYKMEAHFFAARFEEEADGDGEFALHWVDATRCKSDFFHECHVWATQQ